MYTPAIPNVPSAVAPGTALWYSSPWARMAVPPRSPPGARRPSSTMRWRATRSGSPPCGSRWMPKWMLGWGRYNGPRGWCPLDQAAGSWRDGPEGLFADPHVEGLAHGGTTTPADRPSLDAERVGAGKHRG